MENAKPLLQVKNLKKYYNVGKNKLLHAVDDVSFDVYPGETLGLVGESGCGKSTVGTVITRLNPSTGGQVMYKGSDIFKADRQVSFELRKKMQIIFQDPYSSLNPKLTVKAILEESFEIHKLGKTKRERNELIWQLCEDTGISTTILNHYPHELDGGTRQIVGIARALSLNPEFIVCDEPVSSLDVSVQAKIINRLMELQKKRNLSYLFVSHDLSVVRHISNRIAVMYLGQIVEIAPTDEIFENTCHPYSIALLSAIPRVDVDHAVNRIVLKGDVPSPVNPAPGCRFAPRCWMAGEKCEAHTPELREVCPGHCVACHYALESRKRMASAVHTSLR